MTSPFASVKPPIRIVGCGAHASTAKTRKKPSSSSSWRSPSRSSFGSSVAVHETTGGTMSCTVTVCVAVDWLCEASVAVQVTTVGPTSNLYGALFLNVGAPAQSSTAVGRPRTAGPQLLSVMSGGTDVKTGAVV